MSMRCCKSQPAMTDRPQTSHFSHCRHLCWTRVAALAPARAPPLLLLAFLREDILRRGQRPVQEVARPEELWPAGRRRVSL